MQQLKIATHPSFFSSEMRSCVSRTSGLSVVITLLRKLTHFNLNHLKRMSKIVRSWKLSKTFQNHVRPATIFKHSPNAPVNMLPLQCSHHDSSIYHITNNAIKKFLQNNNVKFTYKLFCKPVRREIDTRLRKFSNTRRENFQCQQQDSSQSHTMIMNKWPKWQTKPNNSSRSTKYNRNNDGTMLSRQ